MSIVTDLEDIRTNIIARIKEISSQNKPNYSVDGRSISWADYMKMLMEQLKDINEQIQAMNVFEIRTINI